MKLFFWVNTIIENDKPYLFNYLLNLCRNSLTWSCPGIKLRPDLSHDKLPELKIWNFVEFLLGLEKK